MHNENCNYKTTYKIHVKIFTKAIMKKLMDQCRKLKYLHQVKL